MELVCNLKVLTQVSSRNVNVNQEWRNEIADGLKSNTCPVAKVNNSCSCLHGNSNNEWKVYCPEGCRVYHEVNVSQTF